jgi:type IV pilus assembly protein PilB
VRKLRSLLGTMLKALRNIRSRPSSPSLEAASASVPFSDARARKLVSYQLAHQLRALPISLNDSTLTVACPQSSAHAAERALRFATGLEITTVYVDELLFDDALFAAYHADDAHLSRSASDLNDDAPRNEEAILHVRDDRTDVTRFVSSLIDYALAKRASDLHLLPLRTGCFVKLRIQGQLLSHDEPVCSLAKHEAIIARIKVLASMNTTLRRVPQDGAFRVPLARRDAHVRVSTMPTVHGEKAVLRFINHGELQRLDELGFTARALEFIDEVCRMREGSVLLCGPTGSGKSTTLYSLMKHLQDQSLNVVSIENPVEYVLDGVSQTSVDDDHGLGFAACLRSVLRQDPDVIALGEMRDAESARVAFHAALTGHLLLATVHARRCTEVISRLQQLDVDSLTLSQALSLVICQRLLPRLCESCRVVDLRTSGAVGREIYQRVGCSACDYSGYRGRALAAEALLIDRSLARLIQSLPESTSALEAHLTPQTYVPLRDAYEHLLYSGQIGMDQVLERSNE